MEYMEGGALTDIIENNTMEEDQISSISFEVSYGTMNRILCMGFTYVKLRLGSFKLRFSTAHSGRVGIFSPALL